MIMNNLSTVLLILGTIVLLSTNSQSSPPPTPLPLRCRKLTTKRIHLATEFNRTMNVRTVLFTVADTCKVCWSVDEVHLLVARRMMQDLIPKRIPKDFIALLNYINNCIAVVRTRTTGKVLTILLTALYDTLGGYLHSVALPILNEAYYAGNVDYDTTSQLHYQLNLMMAFLGTNGLRWANPCDMRRIATKVSPLPLKMCQDDSACNLLVTDHRAHGNILNDTIESCTTSDLKIQIPFLDDNSYPSAIAVPFKDHALFSLMSECSVNIIPKFYIMAMRCLAASHFTTRDIVMFNHHLHYWIISTVVPHLHELDRWYPGFGGVMRVVETMNRKGLANTEPIKIDIKTPTINYTECFGQETCGFFGGNKPASTTNFPWFYLLIAVLVLFLLLLCILCIKFIRNRSSDDEVNTLVSLYCGLKEPSNPVPDERSKVNTSPSKTYAATVSSYTVTSSGEASE